jgi:hypothetical protein
VTLAQGVGERSANELMEEMLRAAQVEVNEAMNLLRHTSSNPTSPSRLCPPSPPSSARGAAREVLARTESSTAASSPSSRSSATSSRGEQASSDLARTSVSALEAPARTQDVQEASPEQREAVPTRSGFVAMMRSALAKIHVDADGSEAQAPLLFYEMQQAMTGLLELAYGKAELPSLPDLPDEFATKWLPNCRIMM